jgi:hypothetical protein
MMMQKNPELPLQKPVMMHHQINREERHIGFLFLTAIVSNPLFRKELFDLLNSRSELHLDADEFDVYAEVAIFRDQWNSLGDHTNYTEALHVQRLNMLKGILSAMNIDPLLVSEYDLFWTGEIGRSKLWYPGKWSKTKIEELEAKIVTGTVNKPLFRCRWLCNAKPDIMIHSGENILFIEVKVESGMGSSEQGYSQEQTQNDIIDVGIKVIDWMRQGHVKRINLTHLAEEKDIAWKEITDIYSRTKIQSDIGADMLHRHFQNMPKPKKL